MTIKNKDTFKFFNYKWKKVPNWATLTESKYNSWYLKRYGFKNESNLKKFLKKKYYILDAGCGLGRDSFLFARNASKNAQIIAIDQSKNAIKVCKKNYKEYSNIKFQVADITKKIKFKNKFDFISCDQVLHHTPNPKKTLQNFNSLLKKGGYLNIFVCKKKNPLRDLIDDEIMKYFSGKKPKDLWKFSEIITYFGKAIHDLQIKKLNYQNKKYKSLQELIHYQSFRCWYDPKIPFKLSVSSNYDWFSNNPRYSKNELIEIVKRSIKKFKIIKLTEDYASVSIKIKKL